MRLNPTALGRVTLANDDRWLTYTGRVVNGNISFGSTMSNKDEDKNLNVWKFTGVSPGANVDFTLKHSLGRVPITIVGQDTTTGGVIYRSPVTAWTKTTITVRCTVASSPYNLVVA